MAPELTSLLWSVLLAVAQVVVAATGATMQVGGRRWQAIARACLT